MELLTALWVSGILILFVLMLCMSRVKVRVVRRNGVTEADLQVALFRISFIPGKKRKKQKATAQDKKENVQDAEHLQKKTGLKLTKAEIWDLICTLWPHLKDALQRVRCGIRLDPLNLQMILGGEAEPADCAAQYGYLQAAIWNGMPVLEALLQIPDPHIHTEIDFTAAETQVDGDIGISMRIGTLLGVAFHLGIPVFRWFLRYQQKQKQPQAAAQAAAAERMNQNG